MRTAEGRKIANPIEPYDCKKCGETGMRYQGLRSREGVEKLVYKCVHCNRNTQDPHKQRKGLSREEIDALILERYPKGCKDTLLAESGVSWNVIKNRARVLGVKRPRTDFSSVKSNGIGAKLEYHAAHIDGRMVPMPLDYFSKLVKHQRAWS